jgi:hypothetical protein
MTGEANNTEVEGNQDMNVTAIDVSTADQNGSIPPPWYVFYEFGRQICIGCAVAFGPRRAQSPTIKWQPALKRKHVAFIRWMTVTAFIPAACMITPRVQPQGVTGTWLTTLEFKGERPLEMVVALSQHDACPLLSDGQGLWSPVSAGRFSIAFKMPAESNGSSVRRISGTLSLDELGRLRGPVIAERMGSGGRVVDSIPGVVKAKRIAIKGVS